jgi:hypothetical protein
MVEKLSYEEVHTDRCARKLVNSCSSIFLHGELLCVDCVYSRPTLSERVSVCEKARFRRTVGTSRGLYRCLSAFKPPA